MTNKTDIKGFDPAALTEEDERIVSRMNALADATGDWAEHLPFDAALNYYLTDTPSEDHAAHVNSCTHCQQLIEIMQPREKVLTEFQRHLTDAVREMVAQPSKQPDVSTDKKIRRSALQRRSARLRRRQPSVEVSKRGHPRKEHVYAIDEQGRVYALDEQGRITFFVGESDLYFRNITIERLRYRSRHKVRPWRIKTTGKLLAMK